MADDTQSRQVLDLCDRALGMPESERDQFLDEACEGDARLRESVDSVLVAVGRAKRFLGADDQPVDQALDFTGRQIGSYTLVDRLGSGGMGSVYLAERHESGFNQQVAVKFVHGHILTQELFDRFDAERRILAALNHPYVAALIDAGTTTEGVPYIVMEYIDGSPIDEYCDAQRLNIPARIELLQKIALAVQAAHQNLIVHRDLKPSNVLVTADGIPKLLDFGIAKLIQPTGSDERSEHGATTRFGRQALTPDYASPEQILENKVTTASDVYSLGILAYQLLAGERPYHIQSTSHREIVESIEGLTVPRPSTRIDSIRSGEAVDRIAEQRSTTPNRLRRRLSGDLDNILLKALHRDPDRRYPSVAAFSADLDRYSRGLPVEARPDTVGYRVSRFVQRHKVGVLATGLTAVSLIGGLAGTGIAYLQAEEAREDASRRFGQVRDLANTMMFDVFDEIENVPGAKTAQQKLVSTAQSYLETLTEGESAPRDVRLDAARGYARLSRIYDDQAVADSEYRVRSRVAAEHAEDLYSELAAETPDDVTPLLELAGLRSDRGNSNLYNLNNAVDSRREIEQALTAFDQALAVRPDDPSIAALAFTARIRFADTYKWQNNYTESEAVLTTLIDDIEIVRERFPDDHDILKAAGDARFLIGEVRLFDERLEEAVADFALALDLYRPVSTATGEKSPVRQAEVIAAWGLGNALVNLDRPMEAEEHYRFAMRLTNARILSDPNDRNAQRTYQILRGSLASALVRIGKEEEAFETILSTNDWFEEQAALDPDTPGPARSLAVGYEETAYIYDTADRTAEACLWFQKALDEWISIDQRFGIADFDKEQPDMLRELLVEC